MAIYCKLTTLRDVLFVMFAVVWVITRMTIFPFWSVICRITRFTVLGTGYPVSVPATTH